MHIHLLTFFPFDRVGSMSFFQNLMMKQMLKRQMQGVSPEEQEKVAALISQNPDFFQNIALEVDKKMKEGKDQMSAVMEVMQANQAELQKMVGKK
jgi:hypothetical protein